MPRPVFPASGAAFFSSLPSRVVIRQRCPPSSYFRRAGQSIGLPPSKDPELAPFQSPRYALSQILTTSVDLPDFLRHSVAQCHLDPGTR